MRKKKRSPLLEILKTMPPLYHKHPNVPLNEWNINNSEVLKWALEHDELKAFFTNQLKNSNYIEYDPATGQWVGVNFDKK